MAETFSPHGKKYSDDLEDLKDFTIGDRPEDNDPSLLPPGEYAQDEYGYKPHQDESEYYLKTESNPDLIKVTDKRGMSHERQEIIKQSWQKQEADIKAARVALEAASEDDERPLKASLTKQEADKFFGRMDQLWDDVIDSDPIVKSLTVLIKNLPDAKLNLRVNPGYDHPEVQGERLILPDEKYLGLIRSFMLYQNSGDRLTESQSKEILGQIGWWLKEIEDRAEEDKWEKLAPAELASDETASGSIDVLPAPEASKTEGGGVGQYLGNLGKSIRDRIEIKDEVEYKQAVKELGSPGFKRLAHPLHNLSLIVRLRLYRGPRHEPAQFFPPGHQPADKELAEYDEWFKKLREDDEDQAKV